MKVLQICHKMPVPPLDGGAQLIHYTSLGLLSQGVDLKILAINPSRRPVNIKDIDQKYILQSGFESVFVDTRIKPIDALLNIFEKDSYFISRFKSFDFENKLVDILKLNSYDIIQLEHLYLCQFLPTIRKNTNAKIILRPQNIEYVIWERFQKNISNPFKRKAINVATKRLKKFEQSVPQLIDGIIPVTKDDADIFRQLSTTPVEVIPMGYDTDCKSFNLPENESCCTFYHLASMDWRPNEEAVKWFLSDIYPKLPNNVNFKIFLAGSKMPKWIYKFSSENILVSSEVTDPVSFQHGKKIMIVPLKTGSGIRAKIIEGLALGKTIITTTIGAQGIDHENGKNILIADSPEEFADKMVYCINYPAIVENISQNAKLLSKQYHYNAIGKRMVEFYLKL